MGNAMEANAGQCKNDLSGYIAALPINLGGTEEANCGLGYSLRKDLLARRKWLYSSGEIQASRALAYFLLLNLLPLLWHHRAERKCSQMTEGGTASSLGGSGLRCRWHWEQCCAVDKARISKANSVLGPTRCDTAISGKWGLQEDKAQHGD